MFDIEKLSSPSESEVGDINELLKQLRSDPTNHVPISPERLQEVIASPNTAVLIIRDNDKIIATGTIIWGIFFVDRFAFIEDIVVDAKYRGRGLGRKMMSALIELARQNRVETIALTSRPTRVEANALYPKLGFQKKETNYYELDL